MWWILHASGPDSKTFEKLLKGRMELYLDIESGIFGTARVMKI